MIKKTIRERLESGELDKKLAQVYQTGDLEVPRARAEKVLAFYEKRFGTGDAGIALYSAPGRTELGGNHTDHQRGKVLAASVNLDLLSAAAPNGTSKVALESEGYPLLEIDLADTSVHPEEVNQTAALIRGIAAAFKERGFPVRGFNACAISDVPGGSGLSSSAAFEVLIGVIFNHLCADDALDAVEIAKIGQWAENVYFGKPCGLMDQMASSVGGVIAIDFEKPDEPVITKVPFSFADSGYKLCIIDSGADHADLTEDYAAVPAEMRKVAAAFGKDVLREVSEEAFFAGIPQLRQTCGDRAVLRAAHFYEENRRVGEETAALMAGDFETYMKVAEASGRSSFMYLQNVYSNRFPDQQAVAVALMTAEKLLGGRGVCRVHGGGFAGTIQAFVPEEAAEAFRRGMDQVLGEGRCKVLMIRPVGGVVIE